MIIRVEAFLTLFDHSAAKIRAVPGCQHLELWQDARFSNILSTYSLWDSEESLAAYRASPLFRTTWSEAKALFAAPPKAVSSTEIRGHPAKEG
jgi:quinol monooxygenase YgiN